MLIFSVFKICNMEQASENPISEKINLEKTNPEKPAQKSPVLEKPKSEVIDLREELKDIDLHVRSSSGSLVSLRKPPKMYSLLIKCSHGLIKNEEQAQKFFVVIIIMTNLVTFYLLYKNFGGEQEKVPAEVVPAVQA